MRWGSPQKNLRLIFSTIFSRAKPAPRSAHSSEALSYRKPSRTYFPAPSFRKTEQAAPAAGGPPYSKQRAERRKRYRHSIRRHGLSGALLPVEQGSRSAEDKHHARRLRQAVRRSPSPPSRPELLSPPNTRVVTAFSHAGARFHAAEYTPRFFPGVMRHSRHGTFRRQ